MLDQLRLESYGCCCKMRVTTAVSLLGWVGIITSVLAVLGGIVVAVVPPVISKQLIWILPGVVIILIFLIPLIINSFLIKRNRAGSFSGVKSIIQIICKFFLSLELIASLVLLFSMAALIALTVLGSSLLAGITDAANNGDLSQGLNLTGEQLQGWNNVQQVIQDSSKYEDYEACEILSQQANKVRQGLGELSGLSGDQPAPDPAAVLRCLSDAGPVFLAIFILAFVMALVWLIFLCLAIHGIRKNRKTLLNAYIIFNILLLLVPIALQILSLFTQPDPANILVGVIPGIIGNIVSFAYHIGFFVVLYNMMDVSLDYAQEMKRI